MYEEQVTRRRDRKPARAEPEWVDLALLGMKVWEM